MAGLALSRRPGQNVVVTGTVDDLQLLIDRARESGSEQVYLGTVMCQGILGRLVRLKFDCPTEVHLQRAELLARSPAAA